MYNKIKITAATNKGSREENQDNFRIDTRIPYTTEEYVEITEEIERDGRIHLACVFDGVGGACYGRLAAIRAAESIDTFLREQKEEQKLDAFVECIVNEMAKDVSEFFEKLEECGGTTVALLAWKNQEFYALNIGDSPIYLIRDNQSIKLSIEHTLAGYKKLMDIRTSKGDEDILLNYIGRSDITGIEMAHIVKGKIHVGDRFFLCTDGITKVFHKKEIEKKLINACDVKEMVDKAAYAENDSDNCTGMLIAFT